MHREGKSTHINTRSWKCWLENNKLGENKSQILLWIKEEVLYDLEEHEAPWLGACRESKQVFSPKGALKRDENVDVLPSNERHLSSLNPLWIWTAQCLLLHEKKKKIRDGMKEILLQLRSATNPCPCGCVSIPMASMTAAWECQGRNHCLLLSAKLSFLLAKRNSISLCCVLGVPGGARWIIMNIPHLPAQEAAERTLPLFGRALSGHQPKPVRHADIQTWGDITTLHRDTVLREPLSWACFLNSVIWERKWKNYLKAIPQ